MLVPRFAMSRAIAPTTSSLTAITVDSTRIVRSTVVEVPGVGAAAVEPVHDVVDLDMGFVAARHPTATIAAFDDPSGAQWHDVLRTSDRERNAFGFPHRLYDTVTRHSIGQRFRDAPAVGRGRRAVGDIEVHPRPEPITTTLRVDGVERAFGDIDQRVGPRHVFIARGEDRIAPFRQRGLDPSSIHHIEVRGQSPPAVTADAERDPVLRFDRHVSLIGVAGEQVRPQRTPQPRHRRNGAEVREIGIGPVGCFDRFGHLLERQLACVEQCRDRRIPIPSLRDTDHQLRSFGRQTRLPHQIVRRRLHAADLPTIGGQQLGHVHRQAGVQQVQLPSQLGGHLRHAEIVHMFDLGDNTPGQK